MAQASIDVGMKPRYYSLVKRDGAGDPFEIIVGFGEESPVVVYRKDGQPEDSYATGLEVLS